MIYFLLQTVKQLGSSSRCIAGHVLDTECMVGLCVTGRLHSNIRRDRGHFKFSNCTTKQCRDDCYIIVFNKSNHVKLHEVICKHEYRSEIENGTHFYPLKELKSRTDQNRNSSNPNNTHQR